MSLCPFNSPVNVNNVDGGGGGRSSGSGNSRKSGRVSRGKRRCNRRIIKMLHAFLQRKYNFYFLF